MPRQFGSNRLSPLWSLYLVLRDRAVNQPDPISRNHAPIIPAQQEQNMGNLSENRPQSRNRQQRCRNSAPFGQQHIIGPRRCG